MQLHQMIEQFVKQVCAGKTNETPTAYKSKLRHLEKFLGADRETITQEDIDNFKIYVLNRKTKQRGGEEIKEPLSRFTIRSVLATTKHFLTWAMRKNYLPQGLELENIKEPRPEPKAIAADTVDRLLLAAQSTGEDWERARNIAIIYVLRDTGGRVGSLARLEMESLNLADGYAIVRDKGDQLSWLWFSASTVAAIRAWLHWRAGRAPLDYKLFTGKKGRGLTREGIYRAIERLADVAGITDRHNPHSFRHAFARDSLLAGADLSQVSQMMNHSSVAVTDKYYARWTKKELKQFHDKFSPGRDLPTPEQE